MKYLCSRLKWKRTRRAMKMRDHINSRKNQAQPRNKCLREGSKKRKKRKNKKRKRRMMKKRMRQN